MELQDAHRAKLRITVGELLHSRGPKEHLTGVGSNRVQNEQLGLLRLWYLFRGEVSRTKATTSVLCLLEVELEVRSMSQTLKHAIREACVAHVAQPREVAYLLFRFRFGLLHRLIRVSLPTHGQFTCQVI